MEKEECEGKCIRDHECTGKVKQVIVNGGVAKDYKFYYCDTAIETDRRRGFTVEVISEH